MKYVFRKNITSNGSVSIYNERNESMNRNGHYKVHLKTE